MSKSNGGNSSGGIGFFGVLQVAFIVLKLIGKISWSWIWVFSPTWIVILIAVLIVMILTWLRR